MQSDGCATVVTPLLCIGMSSWGAYISHPHAVCYCVALVLAVTLTRHQDTRHQATQHGRDPPVDEDAEQVFTLPNDAVRHTPVFAQLMLGNKETAEMRGKRQRRQQFYCTFGLSYFIYFWLRDCLN